MVEIQTKSGFVWNVDEKRVTDWDFAKALAESESEDVGTQVKAIAFLVPYLLGKDGEAALADHVKDENGVKPTLKVISEFREILNLLGEKSKKSASSQE